jgi:hypothetical protein
MMLVHPDVHTGCHDVASGNPAVAQGAIELGEPNVVSPATDAVTWMR